MRDALPKKIRENESGVINLDDSEGEGTHWTAYLKKKKYVYYFDSIGRLKPPLELIQYFRSRGSDIIILYNFDNFQSFDSHNCGQLALRFLFNAMKINDTSVIE